MHPTHRRFCDHPVAAALVQQIKQIMPRARMIRDEEAAYLLYLAQFHYRGLGVIVDGGSFTGRLAWHLRRD
jgi:hypothetical protein